MIFCKSFFRIFWLGLVACSPILIKAQNLPPGEYHSNRERTMDILHYRADLRIDFEQKKVFGSAAVKLLPLTSTAEITLDAIRLNVEQVTLMSAGQIQPLKFQHANESLTISLNRYYSSRDTLKLVIGYACTPNAGMYFQRDASNPGKYFLHTYGEGGLHANWLPIYSDVNDKFTTEMVVSVPKSYTVVSNGKLLDVKQNARGERVFHWLQTRPHANYLIAIYAGEFDKGELPPAFGEIPLNFWTSKGRLSQGAFAFRNTTKMVEFFSERFDYRYPWEKYDQIAIPDYAIGAMEHTSVTGHRASVLRDKKAPVEFGPPVFEHFNNFWSAEGTISHELAHHWFGNLLTCRNLSFIWLNESFASYLQMLWDEASVGREQLLMDRQVALDRYLDYVTTEHLIRPLEYPYFEKPDDMYNEEHTYLKGAIVLHLLRNILGDEAFFRGLSHYLHKFEFSNVESSDLKSAIEEATGQNLDWFFEDWVYGGGHPVFEVSYHYLKKHQLIDLKVQQIQPIVEGQDLFTVPVTITAVTASGKTHHTVWVEGQEEQFFIKSAEVPLMVSFDGEGALVAEIDFPKDLDELVYQARHDELPGRIRALRALAKNYATHPRALNTLVEIAAEEAFWGLQAEAARQLGKLRAPDLESKLAPVLKASDYRVRKAAVLALAEIGTQSAKDNLKRVVLNDPQPDVAATAIVALARSNFEIDSEFIKSQLGKPAWYDEITIACLQAFEKLADADLVPDIKPFFSDKYNQQVRMSALNAWKSCAPEDDELHKTLMDFVQNSPYSIQQLALEMLGELYVVRARPALEKIIRDSGDVNLRV
ncbi:MAG: M1 family aminopeptidase, partial [bacterium]